QAAAATCGVRLISDTLIMRGSREEEWAVAQFCNHEAVFVGRVLAVHKYQRQRGAIKSACDQFLTRCSRAELTVEEVFKGELPAKVGLYHLEVSSQPVVGTAYVVATSAAALRPVLPQCDPLAANNICTDTTRAWLELVDTFRKIREAAKTGDAVCSQYAEAEP